MKVQVPRPGYPRPWDAGDLTGNAHLDDNVRWAHNDPSPATLPDKVRGNDEGLANVLVLHSIGVDADKIHRCTLTLSLTVQVYNPVTRTQLDPPLPAS